MGYPVRHDFYPAAHHSGPREAPCIAYFVIHTGEVGDLAGGAEAMGRYFQMDRAGGSTHYGVDNDSIQQYLGDEIECWGAPPLNDSGLHMEFSGRAAWTRAYWLANAKPMLDRGAYLIACKCKEFGIPIRYLTISEMRRLGPKPAAPAGIVTHAQVSRAWGQTTHTDPGGGFPLDYLIDRIRFHASGGATPMQYRVGFGWGADDTALDAIEAKCAELRLRFHRSGPAFYYHASYPKNKTVEAFIDADPSLHRFNSVVVERDQYARMGIPGE